MINILPKCANDTSLLEPENYNISLSREFEFESVKTWAIHVNMIDNQYEEEVFD
jgi:hypothetical protein